MNSTGNVNQVALGPSKRIASACQILLANLALIACTSNDAPPVGSLAAVAEEVAFDSIVALERTLTPTQTDETLIARLTDVDAGGDGTVVIADASEGNVKIYPGGKQQPIIMGRRGDGPGEFRRPIFVRLANDSIFVGDTNAVVHVFDRAGSYTRRFRVIPAGMLYGMEVLPDGSFLMIGNHTDHANKHVLFNIDRNGALLREFLPISEVRPTGSDQDAVAWEPFRSFNLAVRRDTAFVTATLSDSLWSVALDSGQNSVQRVMVPGVVHSKVLPDVSSLADMSQFFRQQVRTLAPVPTKTRILVPYLRNDEEGDRIVVTAASDPRGGWTYSAGEIVLTRSIEGMVLGYQGFGDSLAVHFFHVRED